MQKEMTKSFTDVCAERAEKAVGIPYDLRLKSVGRNGKGIGPVKQLFEHSYEDITELCRRLERAILVLREHGFDDDADELEAMPREK